MARSKSVLKRQRQSETRQKRNQAVRSELKTHEKRARKAAGTDEAATELKSIQKRLDKAASAGVIHRNKAARKKSRLAKAANAAAK